MLASALVLWLGWVMLHKHELVFGLAHEVQGGKT
jgi:hypothetical protein